MGKELTEGQRITKAREKFFAGIPELLEGSACGQYLRNRLMLAFSAGWDAKVADRQRKRLAKKN